MMGMIPNILEFMKPGPSVAAAAPVMSGGGGIPTVKEITEAMLNSENNQAGGGKEGTVFMGVLGFTVFAGLTLALVRGKHFPSAK
jgi:hypothetical protein